MKNQMLALIAGIFMLLPGCTSSGPHLKVAVAASLLNPMEEISEVFHETTGIRIDLISASSGAHMAQITNGAPFDLFFSANEAYPRMLHEKGFTRESPSVLNFGQLALWTKEPLSELDVFSFLGQGETLKIAIANPGLAPYGEAARTWLQENRLWDTLQTRMVFGENVGQVNHFIYAAAVDVAFTSFSASRSTDLREAGNWQVLPASKGIPNAIVLLKNAGPEAQRFKEFLYSGQSRQIFEAYGYLNLSP